MGTLLKRTLSGGLTARRQAAAPPTKTLPHKTDGTLFAYLGTKGDLNAYLIKDVVPESIMKPLLSVVGISFGAFLAVPAYGQRLDGNDGALEKARYDSTDITSPSNVTSTVSPSSVPQAFSRLDSSDTSASVSLGTSYATGKFGTASNTEIWTSALGARLRLSNWELTASLPWMQIRSRSTVFTGIDATPILVAPNTALHQKTSQGFGDLTVGGSYTIDPGASNLEIELSGRAKLSTASKGSHVSSGANDYSLGADVSLPLGNVTPFASFSYRFLGDTSAYHLRNGPAASVGASYAIGSKSFLLVSYHYALAATRLVDNSHEIFGGASTQIAGSSLRLTGYATAGLSRGAAATSGGLALSVNLRNSRVRR